jgi:Ran GTPase-activating protein (RanGAP) involved in mRNA processing and transport
VLIELNIANNNLAKYGQDMSGVIAIANVIKDMGALLVLSLEGNCLRAVGGKALAAGLKGNQVITELNVSYNELGRNSRLATDPSGITAIADAILGMGALSVLSLKDNSLCNREAGKALSEMLAVNTVLKVLDVSSNRSAFDNSACDGPGFAEELAVGLSDNGALSSLNLASTNLGQLVLPEGWTEKKGGFMNASVIGSQHTGGTDQTEHPGKPEGIIAIAAAIPDMRALSILSLENNSLGVDGGKALAEGLKGNSVLIELNIANNNLAKYGQDMSGVIAIANVIKDMGALLVLSLKSNKLGMKEAGEALGDMLKGNSMLKELDISDNWVHSYVGGDATAFAQGISKGLPGNGALSKLDLSMNEIPAAEADMLNATCKAKEVDLAL